MSPRAFTCTSPSVSTIMCRISKANPAMTLMTTRRRATPSATPRTEIIVKNGNRRPVGKSCLSARWRYQGTGSGAARGLRLRGAQLREQDHVPDALGPGEEHAEPVDPDAHAPRGRHAVLKRGQEVLVDALGLAASLLLEHLALDVGVVLLGVRRGDLHATDAELEDVERRRVLAVDLGQGVQLPRQVHDEGRLDQVGLDLLR